MTFWMLSSPHKKFYSAQPRDRCGQGVKKTNSHGCAMSTTDLYDEWKQHVSTSMQILEMQCIWDHSWDFFLGWGKTIQSHGICFQSCWIVLFLFLFFYFLFLHTFGVELFSGQDEVRTSNLLHLPWDFLHSGLMLQQLSHLAKLKALSTSSHTTPTIDHNCHF